MWYYNKQKKIKKKLGEGCFLISIYRKTNLKLGWTVQLMFKINLHQKDMDLLKNIKDYFGVGRISKHGSDSIQYHVHSVKDLQIIVSHFYKFNLITQKRVDYELWKKAFNLIINKEHLTMEGLQKIVAIRASLNRGLSPELESVFSNITPIDRPLIATGPKISDSSWLAGFASAEGSFTVKTVNSASCLTGVQVYLRFQLTQHSRDEQLIKSLREYFGCGAVHPDRDTFNFLVTKFSDIRSKIIPFFAEYPVQGVKFKDYLDWCKAAELIENKDHLTQKGLDQIRKIKDGMNTGRV